MTKRENSNSGAPTLAEIRTEGCKIADQMSEAATLINLNYQSASAVLGDTLWPYCHAMAKGPAQDFLELLLMDAKEDLGTLTSPWEYHWGPDRDRLMETQDIPEATRIVATLKEHLGEKIPADAVKAENLRNHLVGLAALLDAAARHSVTAKQ